jgi:uncharacterized protein YfcZ (UPF0381/DUF406 family)
VKENNNFTNVIKEIIILVIITFFLIRLSFELNIDYLFYIALYFLPLSIGIFIGKIEGMIIGFFMLIWLGWGVVSAGYVSENLILRQFIYYLRLPLIGGISPFLHKFLTKKLFKSTAKYKDIGLKYFSLIISLGSIWLLIHLLGLYLNVFEIKIESYILYGISILITPIFIFIFDKTINKKLSKSMGSLIKIIRNEEIEKCKVNLQNCPMITNAFGKEWIESNLLNKEERLNKHSLFWIILNTNKCRMLEDWLSILNSSLISTKFTKIINNLKNKREDIEFYSLLSEIEVLAYYKKQENDTFKVEYEPAIPNKTEVGDIKLIIDNKEVYLEITRLFSSDEEKELNSIMKKIKDGINNIDNNPYIISFGLTTDFMEDDISPFINFINEELTKVTNLPTEKIYFVKDKIEKAWFYCISKTENGRGYVGSFILPVIEIRSAIRIKNKILDEIKQLPSSSLNIVVIDISHYFADFDDVEDAFAGQFALNIDKKTFETTSFREANGVINTVEGKQLSGIIAFKGFGYKNRKIYVNSSATLSLVDDVIKKL